MDVLVPEPDVTYTLLSRTKLKTDIDNEFRFQDVLYPSNQLTGDAEGRLNAGRVSDDIEFEIKTDGRWEIDPHQIHYEPIFRYRVKREGEDPRITNGLPVSSTWDTSYTIDSLTVTVNDTSFVLFKNTGDTDDIYYKKHLMQTAHTNGYNCLNNKGDIYNAPCIESTIDDVTAGALSAESTLRRVENLDNRVIIGPVTTPSEDHPKSIPLSELHKVFKDMKWRNITNLKLTFRYKNSLGLLFHGVTDPVITATNWYVVNPVMRINGTFKSITQGIDQGEARLMKEPTNIGWIDYEHKRKQWYNNTPIIVKNQDFVQGVVLAVQASQYINELSNPNQYVNPEITNIIVRYGSIVVPDSKLQVSVNDPTVLYSYYRQNMKHKDEKYQPFPPYKYFRDTFFFIDINFHSSKISPFYSKTGIKRDIVIEFDSALDDGKYVDIFLKKFRYCQIPMMGSVGITNY